MKRYEDLRDGGRALAAALTSYANRNDVLVLGIVRGGVPAAIEVATRLELPLDLLHLTRLLAPRGPESAICAGYVAGTRIVDEALEAHRGDAGFEAYLAEAFARLDAREQTVRGAHAPRDLANKTILLIDNGIRSGSTMRSSIRLTRRLGPSSIIAAVPVGSAETREEIESLADEVVCLGWPETFGNAGMWYSKFNVPSDEEFRSAVAKPPLFDPDTKAVPPSAPHSETTAAPPPHSTPEPRSRARYTAPPRRTPR